MRREHDFYPTPQLATRELLSRVNIRGRVLECCSGAGDIVTPLTEDKRITLVDTNDLDRRHLAKWHEDATDAAWWKTLPEYDWIVTNPIFLSAHKILPLAVKHAKIGVAFLLRITYLEPCEGRGLWLSELPPDGLIVLPRISFTEDGGTDSATCAWMVWGWMNGAPIQVVAPLVDDRQASLLTEQSA